MPRVLFTPQLRRFTATPEVDTPATTLRAALDDAFAANPALRGYVLDDQGHPVQRVKARELAGQSGLLFVRNGTNGQVECRTNRRAIELNALLHAHN